MFLGFSARGPVQSTVPEVDVDAIERLRDSHRLVDVRSPIELDGPQGKIPGVENVPLERLARVADGWNRDEPILLICRSGARSAHATRILLEMGFDRAVNLRGGMIAYGARSQKRAA